MTILMSMAAVHHTACMVTTTPPVTATMLPDEQRMNFWPRCFGYVRQWVFLEPQVFSWLDLWSTGYQGGIWAFHTLSDGGAFLTPPERDHYHLFNAGNGNEVTLTTEATGISVCLMTWSHHACRTRCDVMTEHYYRLRDYALTHPESHAIMRITD